MSVSSKRNVYDEIITSKKRLGRNDCLIQHLLQLRLQIEKHIKKDFGGFLFVQKLHGLK